LCVYDAVLFIKSLSFNDDPVKVKTYIERRLSLNEALTLAEDENENISPSEFNMLRKCPATSVSVERSFSMLGKLYLKIEILKKKMFLSTFRYILTQKV
jgi:hypothetical protein